VGVVYADAYICDERGQIIQRFSLNEGRRHPVGDILEELLQGNFIQLTSAMVRRNCLEAVGYFDESYPPAGEDWEFWLRVASRFQFHYLDQPVAMYRVHSAQTIQNRRQMMEDYRAGCEKIRQLPFFLRVSAPARCSFYCSLGILCLKLGRVKPARRLFGQAVALSPRSCRPYVLFACSFLNPRLVTAHVPMSGVVW
jgi:hypothetical protein